MHSSSARILSISVSEAVPRRLSSASRSWLIVPRSYTRNYKACFHRVLAEAPEVINSVYIAVLTRVAPISVILSVTFHQVVVLAL